MPRVWLHGCLCGALWSSPDDEIYVGDQEEVGIWEVLHWRFEFEEGSKVYKASITWTNHITIGLHWVILVDAWCYYDHVTWLIEYVTTTKRYFWTWNKACLYVIHLGLTVQPWGLYDSGFSWVWGPFLAC